MSNHTIVGIYSVLSTTTTTSNEETSSGSSTYFVSSDTLKEGYSRIMKSKQKIKFNLNEVEETIEITSVDSENKKVEFSLDGKNYEVAEGEIQKIDTNSDGYYDLQVSVSEIKENKYAELEFKEIYEEVPSEEEQEQAENVVGEERISFWNKIGNFFRKVWDWIVFWK